jgi:hypothetical protein
MTRAQQAILLLVTNVLLIGALMGLFARRRVRLAYFFVAYLIAIVVLSSLVGLWPDRFHTWSFYWTKESVYSFLKVGAALELALRVFQAFPAAARAARIAFLLVITITVVAAWTVSAGSEPGHSSEQQWANLVLAYHPRITNGTAWLFGAMFALILYYRLPLHSLHKAIAFGFMSYLLLLTFVLDVLKRSDFAASGLVSYTNALGYTTLAAYWAWAAWRRDPPPPVAPEVVSRLQPWREGASPDL